MLGKFNGPNPIILVIEHLVIDSCRELQRCHLFNLCMRVVFVIENDLLVRSVTSEIIHREREHPHLFEMCIRDRDSASQSFISKSSDAIKKNKMLLDLKLKSVSYTHLDVYKRQTVRRSPN